MTTYDIGRLILCFILHFHIITDEYVVLFNRKKTKVLFRDL